MSLPGEVGDGENDDENRVAAGDAARGQFCESR